ncbi:sodium/potassium/calcium exchanger 1 isoform X4 [Oryzias melastigma]|uniref:Sodium/potassium/calcium exchanger 1 n=1 Tax=Oryzias melastigma TaxID=30732 RepID=A0A3B3E111_ORYME|nr:sodium/potassium/calcium exchanger 1 isoform X4 [Oryzias melastigma]
MRRLRRSRVLFFISGVLLCFVYTLTLKAKLSQLPASAGAEGGHDEVLEVRVRELLGPNETEAAAPGSTQPPLLVVVNRTDIEQCVYVDPLPPKPPPTPPPLTTSPPAHPPGLPPHRKGDYPEDLFTIEQRRQGWVLLHVLGMIYMFVALAIVCDEFFVPALEVITVKLEISDDVAGATFMAAGGSAPELFTSLIGVFISHSNVGIGTIVGSAVFNILFVIGMCAIFSREMLHLTWWPLFRDVTFYILDLIMLIIFFLDNVILWWESILLVLGYMSYVSFMKFNSQIEQMFKGQLNKHMSIVKVWTAEEPEKESEAAPLPAPPPPPAPPAAAAPPKAEEKPKAEGERPPSSAHCNSLQADPQQDKTRLRVRPVLQRGGSSASLHNTSLRNTIFQLMIHTLDPLGEDGDQRAKSEQPDADGPPGGEPSSSQPAKTEEQKKTTDNAEESKASAASEGGLEGSDGSSEDESGNEESSDPSESDEDEEKAPEENEEEEKEPLSLEWPDTPRKQATYLFLLPIILPLWFTLPDVRNVTSRRFFVITFLGSIFWIGIFSYMMVWWAHQVGETIGISEEIMGLTILAAGTSIPDLITSVIVARKGLGDMAVSSSVGSNIFDITMGLPIPWLLYTLLHNGDPVVVSSNGLFCAIVLLFLMLLFVIISIAACRWKMSKMLGLTMFVLYFVFLVLSVLLEDRILTCPISI